LNLGKTNNEVGSAPDNFSSGRYHLQKNGKLRDSDEDPLQGQGFKVLQDRLMVSLTIEIWH